MLNIVDYNIKTDPLIQTVLTCALGDNIDEIGP